MARGGSRRAPTVDHAPRASRSDGRSRPVPTSNRLRELSERSRGVDPNRLFLATLRVRVPLTLWVGQFTRRHPEIRIEILNQGVVTPEVSVSDYWMSGGPPGIWTVEIASYPDVVKVEGLAEVGGGSLYRIAHRNPPVVYLYRRLRLPLQFPLWVEGGRIRWEVAARYSEYQEVLEHARSVDPTVQVASIRRGPLRSHLPLLTDVQQRMLDEALAAGYFAVPRGITLTELARKLNRSKSSVSESIALIEQKLLETAVRPAIVPV